MQINYNVTGAKRKELVNAISQQLNAPVKYLGAPTFAYEMADYNVNKNGVLSGPDNKELVDNLLGLHDFKAISEQQRVMRLRYVEGLSWRQVSRKAHYSEKHCLKIHRAALKRIPNDTFHGGTMIS